jgi:hypothetical protein
MNDSTLPPSPKPFAKEIRRITLVVPLICWCIGFGFSLFNGNSVPQALPRATAFALSWLAGWTVFLLVRRPSDHPSTGATMIYGNVVVLQATSAPFSFLRMLAVSLIVTVPCGLLMGLIGRAMGRRRNTLPGLVDPEIDRPSPDR